MTIMDFILRRSTVCTAAKPDWESPNGLTIADALAQCAIAYGPFGFAEVRIRAEQISAMHERDAARAALDAMPPRPEFFREEDFPTTPVAQFRAMQIGQYPVLDAWN